MKKIIRLIKLFLGSKAGKAIEATAEVAVKAEINKL
jgi:hypothetical protein